MVKHTVEVGKSLCGRTVETNGTGSDCKACARVQASRDAWAGEPDVRQADRSLAADVLAALRQTADEVQARETVRAEAVETALPKVGDWIHNDARGVTGRVTNINKHGRLVIDWQNGNHTAQHWDSLASDGYEVIPPSPAADMLMINGKAELPGDDAGQPVKSADRFLTGQHRTKVNRRARKAVKRAGKVKSTKASRARSGGRARWATFTWLTDSSGARWSRCAGSRAQVLSPRTGIRVRRAASAVGFSGRRFDRETTGTDHPRAAQLR